MRSTKNMSGGKWLISSCLIGLSSANGSTLPVRHWGPRARQCLSHLGHKPQTLGRQRTQGVAEMYCVEHCNSMRCMPAGYKPTYQMI